MRANFTRAPSRGPSTSTSGAASRAARARSAGDGECAFTDANDRAVEKFWRNWTGAAHCRQIVTKSSRESLYRDPARLESKVRALLRVFPVDGDGNCGSHGLDVPASAAREPRLLALREDEFVKRVLMVKRCVAGISGRQITLAPGLLLCDGRALEEAMRGLEETLGAAEARDAVAKQPDRLLELVGFYGVGDDAEEEERDIGRAMRHYARAVPPVGDARAVEQRVAERELGAKKFHVGESGAI
jgi:hypothetical protein